MNIGELVPVAKQQWKMLRKPIGFSGDCFSCFLCSLFCQLMGLLVIGRPLFEIDSGDNWTEFYEVLWLNGGEEMHLTLW